MIGVIITETKVCKICEEEKELSEYYNQKKKKADGTEYIYYNPECKECTSKRAMKWQKDNYETWFPKRQIQLKNYFDKPENKQKKKEIINRLREEGWYKEYQKENKEYWNEYNRNRNLHKKHEISKNEWEKCKNYFNYRCSYCGLPIEEHYITFRGNIQLGDFHKDHVNPEGSNDLSNCIPACKECNTSKHNTKLDDWYNADNPTFIIERLDKIHKWLDEDYKKFIKIRKKVSFNEF